MFFSISHYKLSFLKKNEKKILKTNKYSLYQYKNWSKIKIERHNRPIDFRENKKCIISKKKKAINFNTNINSHIFKKLISNGELSNLKKAIW